MKVICVSLVPRQIPNGLELPKHDDVAELPLSTRGIPISFVLKSRFSESRIHHLASRHIPVKNEKKLSKHHSNIQAPHVPRRRHPHKP